MRLTETSFARAHAPPPPARVRVEQAEEDKISLEKMHDLVEMANSLDKGEDVHSEDLAKASFGVSPELFNSTSHTTRSFVPLNISSTSCSQLETGLLRQMEPNLENKEN